jgi:potassium inwardly-rectifying channel subfamily J
VVIGRKTTLEGEVIPYYHTQLDCTFDSSHDSMFFIWPATMVHVIDENSPFYSMSSEEISREKFEIVAILEGTIESTGQSVQARSSFLPSEILWGHRFEQLINYKKESGEYRVDYSKFNNTYEVDSPTCSAKDLYEYQRYVNQTSPFPRISPTEFFTSRGDDKTTTSGDSGTSQNAINNLTVRSLGHRGSGRSTYTE